MQVMNIQEFVGCCPVARAPELARVALDALRNDLAVQVILNWAKDADMVEETYCQLGDALPEDQDCVDGKPKEEA